MILRRVLNLSGVVVLLMLLAPLRAQDSPSFYRQIRPILGKYCLHCHNSEEPKGGLDVSTYEDLMLGGNTGDAVVPGKPEESLLLQLVLKQRKPHMPPAGERQPTSEEIELLRRWIAAGAPDDSDKAGGALAIPMVQSRVSVPPPVTALSVSPDGKLAVAAVHRHVLLLDPVKGELWGRLGPFEHPVSAVAINADATLVAVAYGMATIEGKIAIFELQGQPLYSVPEPARVFDAHSDLIYRLAFSPSAPAILASCSYDKMVKLWDCRAGKHVKDLKDHSDAVYGLAWSPDGKYLATAAADRTVKVWHVESGKRLFSLTESTDWLYAVAWHPKKNFVAAGGVDKSIRVWAVDESGGTIVHSVFAHTAPIVGLCYSPDGQHLFSVAEDGEFKLWDGERMVEVGLARLGETPYDLGVLPDGNALVGLFDGRIAGGRPGAEITVLAAAELLDAPLPPPPAPAVEQISPQVVSRGESVELQIKGQHLEWIDRVTVAGEPGTIVEKNAGRLVARIKLPSKTPAGRAEVVVQGRGGEAKGQVLVVEFPLVSEVANNDSRTRAQPVPYDRTVAGMIDQSGDVDFYGLNLDQNQEVGIVIRGSELGSKIAPVLRVYDPAGRLICKADGTATGFRATRAGKYVIEVQDAEFRGGGDFRYYMVVGRVPVVTSWFPLGIAPDAEVDVKVRGVNLGGSELTVRIASRGRKPGDWIEIPLSGVAPVNPPRIRVGRFGQLIEEEDSGTENKDQYVLDRLPVTVDGVIGSPGDVDYFVMNAKAGETWVFEVEAASLGSPLDSYLAVLDDNLRPVSRARLRCLAQTYTTFNDRDARQTGFRIEAWSALAVNDYVYVGGELLRILALPRNPDDDVRFFNFAGQRIGYLDTTPSFKPVGTPMYKVEIHPPDAELPPNGMPQFVLYYRNDDAGPPYRPDSRVYFDAPRDGRYIVAIGDARGEGGENYAYRLHVRPPEPAFRVNISPGSPQVWRGGSIPLQITCERIDRFMGDVTIRFQNVPPGFELHDTVVLAETYDMSAPLYATPEAKPPAGDAPPIVAVARAVIDGKPFEQQITVGRPRVVDPGDIVTTVESQELVIRPGTISRLKVSIERRNGFTGRVPLEVLGLPHGVRVLDVGLNGILITERETERVVRFYAEPWVNTQQHWFGIYAHREGKGTLHGARPVLLKVEQGEIAQE